MMRFAAFSCAVGALIIVSLEWIVRQAVGSNLMFAWLEAGSVLGVMLAAFSMPSVSIAPNSGRPGSLGPKVSEWLLVCVAGTLAASFGACVLFGDAASGRSHYFPVFSLRAPFLVIAACLSFWTVRVALRALRRDARGDAVGHSRTMQLAIVMLATSLFALAVSGNDSERLTSLVAQVSWGLLSQEHFLMLVFSILLLELAGRICGSGSARARGRSEAGTTPGGGTESAGAADRSAGDMGRLVLPVGLLTLYLALLLGVPASEAIVSMTAPWVIMVAGSALFVAAPRPKADGSAADSSAILERFAQGSRGLAAGLIVAVALSVALVVAAGYARAVEALAVAVLACLALGVFVARPTRTEAARFASDATARVGQLAVYALAGGAVYMASHVWNLHEAISTFVLSRDIELHYVVAPGLLLATVLARWFSPLGVALSLLPVLPAALEAAGAGTHQALVLYTLAIAAGFVAQAYIRRGQHAADARAGLLLVYTVAVVFLISAWPKISTFAVEARRFW